MEQGHLMTYLARKLYTTEKLPTKKDGKKKVIGIDLLKERVKKFKTDEQGKKEQADMEREIKEIEAKFIPEGTIIVFDEAFGSPTYQEVIRQTIYLANKLGYKVIKMTATFKGIPFSATTTYALKTLY